MGKKLTPATVATPVAAVTPAAAVAPAAVAATPAVPTAPTEAATTSAVATGNPAKKRTAQRKLKYHPGLFNTEGVHTPVAAAPSDWSERKHKPLRKQDFIEEALWYDWMAAFHQKKADHFAKTAVQSRKIGNSEDRAKAKKFLRLREQMAELEAQLRAAGIEMEDDADEGAEVVEGGDEAAE